MCLTIQKRTYSLLYFIRILSSNMFDYLFVHIFDNDRDIVFEKREYSLPHFISHKKDVRKKWPLFVPFYINRFSNIFQTKEYSLFIIVIPPPLEFVDSETCPANCYSPLLILISIPHDQMFHILFSSLRLAYLRSSLYEIEKSASKLGSAVLSKCLAHVKIWHALPGKYGP